MSGKMVFSINYILFALKADCGDWLETHILDRLYTSLKRPRDIQVTRSILVQKSVGQGRVMSAWMFLVFIDKLIYLLQASNCGIVVNSYSIPAILLADDTTLLGSSPNALRTLLNIVYTYATQWRLKYNASKSVMITFNSRNNAKLTLGDREIPTSNSTVYAGVTFSNNHSNPLRTDNACTKARKIFHSLHDLGIKQNGIHPLSCVLIWKRVILPSAL